MQCVDISQYYDYSNPEKYWVIRKILKENGLVIVKRDTGTFACGDGDVEAVIKEALKKSEDSQLIEVAPPELDWTAVRESAMKYFKTTPSLRPTVEFIINNIAAGNNVLMVGSPGSGKSYVLDVMHQVVTDSIMVNMFNATNAGLEDLIANIKAVSLLLVDELDKANVRDLGMLLQLADAGRGKVIVVKSNKTFMIKGEFRILAASNYFRGKRSVAWDALRDRFVTVEVPKPTVGEVVGLFMDMADTEDPILVKLVQQTYDSLSMRRLLSAARYVKTNRDDPKLHERVKNILLG